MRKEIEFEITLSMGFDGYRAEGSVAFDGREISWTAFRAQGVWHPRLDNKQARGLEKRIRLAAISAIDARLYAESPIY